MPSRALASYLSCACALAAVAAVAAPAAPARAERDPERTWRTEAGVGGLLGSVRVEDHSLFGSGVHLDLGQRRDRIMLLASYTFLGASEYAMAGAPEAERRGGHLHRLGGGLRVSAGRWGRGKIRGDLWIDLGAGLQAVRIDGLDERDRGDVSLGIGGQFSARLGKRLRLGAYYAFRSMFAPAERDADAPPICAAPCDTPTRPFPLDRAFLFDIGFVIGN